MKPNLIDLSHAENQIECVTSFEELVAKPYHGSVNALCWPRMLVGDFAEVVNSVALTENIVVLDEKELLALELSEQGNLAREVLLNDISLLKANGASPNLNIISNYARDEDYLVFPTDVYSFHVDQSPIPTYTYLCTYYGASSDIVPNAKAVQKIRIPEIRLELQKLHDGEEEDFDAFLSEYFFDLHYQPLPDAKYVNLGIGHLWRLACDHPSSNVPPCIHRAPEENAGERRLMLIC